MDNMSVDDPSRKRVVREESGKSVEVKEKQKGDPSASALAIVPVGAGMVSPPLIRDPKRSRMEDEERESSSIPVKNLAGSFEERRRAQ